MSFTPTEYTTIFGRTRAERVDEENAKAIAKWLGGCVQKVNELDTPYPLFVKFSTTNTHGENVEERADIGEWIVVPNAMYPMVFSDNLFLSIVQDRPEDVEQRETSSIEEITGLVRQAMQYQDRVTSQGGTVDECDSVAEFIALKVLKIIR